MNIKEETESVTENGISDGKEMNKNNNENATEAEYASVEDRLDMYRTTTNENTLISEIPNIINLENVVIAPSQGKTPVSILGNEFCEEQAFLYLLNKVKFGYSVPQNIPISPARYFNQRLLNFNQYFASDVDYIFFARSVYEQHLLRSWINFAMHKIKPGTLTEGTFKNNFKGTIERFVASDNAFSFMSSVKRTPAYWQQFLYDVLAMVKQLGIPTYFLAFSCVDLRWEDLLYIINKLNNVGLSEEELKNLCHEDKCNLLNNKPVLADRHFQYKVEVFFEEIIIDGPLGKTKYYAIRIEFQEWGIPHVHSFIWIFNAPNIQNEAAYIKFIEQTINGQLPDSVNDPELFELVKTYQVHTHFRTCWKYNKKECCLSFFFFCWFFTEKTIIAKPLDSELTNDEKQEVLV